MEAAAAASAPVGSRRWRRRSRPAFGSRSRACAAYGREALERAGLDPDGAAIVTEVQLEASLRDQPTHNMVSIPRYAQRITAGTINPRPIIRVEHETGISAQVDGDNGPGQWVAVVAMETAIRIAREKGVGIVAVRRSNHLGAAGHYPWLAAREGLIGLCTTNGPVILAPTGGVTPTFGNNPLGVGIPAKCHHPILLDIAMSVAPRGRIGLHAGRGQAAASRLDSRPQWSSLDGSGGSRRGAGRADRRPQGVWPHPRHGGAGGCADRSGIRLGPSPGAHCGAW